jgi:hypothetical protein
LEGHVKRLNVQSSKVGKVQRLGTGHTGSGTGSKVEGFRASGCTACPASPRLETRAEFHRQGAVTSLQLEVPNLRFRVFKF